MRAATPNVRIARHVRTAQGALIRTEIGASWFSPPFTLDYIKRELAGFQAGWKLQAYGTENGWHDWSETI